MATFVLAKRPVQWHFQTPQEAINNDDNNNNGLQNPAK